MVKTVDGPRLAHGTNGINLRVRDVTGTHIAEMTGVDPSMRVSTVAETVASRMSLPIDTTPWALRTESTARYLDDVAIGDAVENGQTAVDLVLTPKAHLG